MNNRILDFILFAHYRKEDLEKIQESVDRDNTRNLSFYTIITLMYFGISLITSMFIASMSENVIPYTVSFIGTLFIFIIFKLKQHKSHRFIIVMVCCYQVVLLGSALLMTLSSPDQLTLMLIVFFILIPVSFVDQPYRFIYIDLIIIVLYFLLAHRFKVEAILIIDGIDIIVFSTVGIVCGANVNKMKYERYFYEQDALELVEMKLKQKENELFVKEAEVSNARMQIMLSQIKPHFLYNSLTAISSLCDSNPEKAKQVTIDFSKYLRANLSGITEKHLVLFERELEYVEAYLRIEKARFEELLEVEYEIGPVDFMVPSLTIQPIVENAVKHGLGRKVEGGTLRIATSESEERWIVCIEDNGEGFDSHQLAEDSELHIGIKNVRERLKTQISGELHIQSELGKGTKVEIVIPKER